MEKMITIKWVKQQCQQPQADASAGTATPPAPAPAPTPPAPAPAPIAETPEQQIERLKDEVVNAKSLGYALGRRETIEAFEKDKGKDKGKDQDKKPEPAKDLPPEVSSIIEGLKGKVTESETKLQALEIRSKLMGDIKDAEDVDLVLSKALGLYDYKMQNGAVTIYHKEVDAAGQQIARNKETGEALKFAEVIEQIKKQAPYLFKRDGHIKPPVNGTGPGSNKRVPTPEELVLPVFRDAVRASGQMLDLQSAKPLDFALIEKYMGQAK